MSDLAAFGTGIGIGLLMMAVVGFFLRDELVAGFKRLFEEPGEARVPNAMPFRTRVAVCFNALAAGCLLGFGLLAGQTIPMLCGGIGLVSLAGFIFTFRRHRPL